MTREDIIRIALEVGFSDCEIDKCQLMLERFAHLVAQHEREACAKEAEGTFYSVQAAENIRARGKA
jgi:hypothetical protein